MNRRPKLTIVAPQVSAEEAAAVIAAIEQFVRASSPVRAPAPEPGPSPWQRAALLEGVSRRPEPVALPPSPLAPW